MTKVETKQIERVAPYVRYFFKKSHNQVFILSKNAKLKGDLDNFIELSKEEFDTVQTVQCSNQNQSTSEYVPRSYVDTSTDILLQTVQCSTQNQSTLQYAPQSYVDMSTGMLKSDIYKELPQEQQQSQQQYSDEQIRVMAENFEDKAIPDFNYANNLLKPISDKIKARNIEFLSDEESDKKATISEGISSIVNQLYNEAKKITPSKFAIKLESSKRISNMFNLSEKRKNKLKIGKKSIVGLQNTLSQEKKNICEQIKNINNTIIEYGNDIINFGAVRDQIQDIIDQRGKYIEMLPERDKSHVEIIFIEKFIRETEKIVALWEDIEAFITSADQRKTMFENNREAFEVVLNGLIRVDNTLIPTIIQEYENYVSNQNIAKSNDVKEAVHTAINNLTARNTSQMRENIKKVYSRYNEPTHNIELMLQRQTELLNVSRDIQEAVAKSRVNNTRYLESLTLIRKSAIEMRENQNTSSVSAHLEYIQKIKNMNV